MRRLFCLLRLGYEKGKKDETAVCLFVGRHIGKGNVGRSLLGTLQLQLHGIASCVCRLHVGKSFVVASFANKKKVAASLHLLFSSVFINAWQRKEEEAFRMLPTTSCRICPRVLSFFVVVLGTFRVCGSIRVQGL